MSPRDRDMFAEWQRRFADEGSAATPLIPAATVIVLRDGDPGLQTLMLRRNSKLEFVGGMWVFPGGRIDEEDRAPDDDAVAAARRGAVREAFEEAGQRIDADGLAWFSHWTPPPITPKRFSTWFFAARASEHEVEIDGGEIHDSAWMTPIEAMERRNALEIGTRSANVVTLETLAEFGTVDEALATLEERTVDFFVTTIGRGEDGPVAMWEGDAGYENGDAATPGPRHRLHMGRGGFRYDRSAKPPS